MSVFARRLQRITAPAAPYTPPSGSITHGSLLAVSDVGPWALQGVAKGSESLSSLIGPSRGYWRFDAVTEFATVSSNYVYNNNPTNYGGIVPAGGMIIDGYNVAAGTYVVQFRDLPDNYSFYAQGTSLKVLFRGCRFRWTLGTDGTGIFNDYTSTASQQIMLQYCDIGLQSLDPPPTSEGTMLIKFIGGANHRLLRNYYTRSSTFIQPNAQGCEIAENYISEYIYAYGEAGTSGAGPDSTTYHLNGISSEGGLTSIKILRNRILCASPDGATGGGNTVAGQIGYGTQPGQIGYGSGTAPGRLTTQTDCIALFSSNGSSNIGDAITGIQVKDNYLGGSGYCLYAGNSKGDCQNIIVTGNTFTTRWWTNGGNFGVVADIPNWGVNGNSQANNVWADDFGSGGNGCTSVADRQYPAGNGPRAGATVL